MSRLISGAGFSVDLKYVAGMAKTSGGMRIMFKGHNYLNVDDIGYTEYVSYQQQFDAYLEEKNKEF